MRVATFNIMHGRSLVDGRVDPVLLAEAVDGLGADVVALQEVDQGQARSGGADLAAAAAVGMGVPGTGYRFVATILGSPGSSYRAAGRDGEDGAGGDVEGTARYGVALLSRWPVLSWHVLRLRPSRVPGPVLLPVAPGRGRLILLRDEPRVVVAARVRGPAGAVTVAGTHLSFVPGWNAAQLRRAVRWLRRLPAPRLLLGDLNLPARVAALASGWRTAGRVATYPAFRPRVQLDHVLVDPDGASGLPPGVVVRTARPRISDHLPLVAEFGGRVGQPG